MKNIVVLVCFSILIVFSCSDPITENEYNFVINFQQGHFPDASYTGAADTYIYEATPTTNFGGNTDFFVGYSGGSNRTLIRFAAYGYMPANATIKKATLTLSVSNVFVTGSAINAHELTAAFTEGAATWNSSNSQFNAAVIGSSTIVMGAESFAIDLSPSVVQKWITAPSQNLGIMLRASPDSGNKNALFFSKEYASAIMRPMLSIVYSL